MFRFANYSEPLPGRIMMFLDLGRSDFMTQEQHKRFLNDKDPELPEEEWSLESNIPSEASCASSDNSSFEEDIDDESIHVLEDNTKLEKGTYCIIRCATTPCLQQNELTEYHLQSRISKRFKLENNLRIIDIGAIEGPCFVVMDNPLEDCNEVNDQIGYYVDDPMWWSEKCFLDTSCQDDHLQEC